MLNFLCYAFGFVLTVLSNSAVADYRPADPILEKKLEIEDSYVPRCYILRPRDSFTYVISEYAIVGTGYCSTANYTWSFDVNGRISTNIRGIDYCLTAPDSVIKRETEIDYVRAFRCDVGNRNQQWYITDDNRIKSLLGDYALQSFNSKVYISKEKGHSYEDILTSNMNDWKNNFSIPRSYNFALSMNWRFGSKPYYANYRADTYLSFRSTEDNSYRVLYSPYKKTLSFQHKSGENESVAYCLKSLSKKGDQTWQYAEISSATVCPKVQSELIPSDMQWEMVISRLPQKTDELAEVKFYDQWGNSLRVWMTGGSWGLGFTIPDDVISEYEKVTTDATDTFYVNRDVAEWGIFEIANQQERAQFCPAPSVDPLQDYVDSSIFERSPRILPSGFTLTPAWYERLWQIAAANAGGSIPGIGVCGTCLLESFEILRELYESGPQMEPAIVNHYFDASSPVSIVDQFANQFPGIYVPLENALQLAVADTNALTDLRRQGYISLANYLISFNTRTFQLIGSAINQMLPDFYQTTPTAMPFLGYTDDLRDQINNYFSQASVGTTAIVGMQITLLNGVGSGHSTPLIRLSDGWVVLEVATPFASRVSVDFFNQARFPTPAEAVFHYYQNRSPYTINGQNNIDFSAFSNFLLFTQINLRPSVIVRNPSVSFGNCSGEGEDGRRGTGTEKEARDLVQNRCVLKDGRSGRCYGNSSSINDDNVGTNGKSTDVKMYNKGGYVAALTISYQELIEGKKINRIRRSSVNLGGVASITVPSNAFDISITGTLKTGLIWRPIKQIFKYKTCRFDNEWYDETLDKNIIKINVWGTTLHNNWSVNNQSGSFEKKMAKPNKCEF